MAQAESSAGIDPAFCAKAEEYVLDRLDRTDHPLSPAELAEEYDCTGVHMRGVMSDLAKDGRIERIARGKYIDTDGDGGDEEASTDLDVSVGMDDDGERDTTPDQGDSTDTSEGHDMTTDDEYTHLHSMSVESGGDGANDDTQDYTGQTGDQANETSDENAGADEVTTALAGVDPRSLMLVVGAGVVVWMLYQGVRAGGGDDDQQDAELDQQGSTEQIDGGLVQG